jgi:hypothetical protein
VARPRVDPAELVHTGLPPWPREPVPPARPPARPPALPAAAGAGGGGTLTRDPGPMLRILVGPARVPPLWRQ